MRSKAISENEEKFSNESLNAKCFSSLLNILMASHTYSFRILQTLHKNDTLFSSTVFPFQSAFSFCKRVRIFKNNILTKTFITQICFRDRVVYYKIILKFLIK